MIMCDAIRTLANCHEAQPHQINPAGRAADVALKEIIEVDVL
jgi:hypothetical protein